MSADKASNHRASEERLSNAVLLAARDYTRRGWRVVPVIPGQKGVALSGWQAMRLDEDDLPKWFGALGGGRGGLYHNIGVLLGEPSGGLVDVDCDVREAREAAAELLPATGLVSGRVGNPASHYWYRIEGELPATAKFGDAGTGASGHHRMLIELRSTGQQTVVPPSAHPSGETLRWERGSITQGEPGVAPARDLRAAVARVAAVALLARHWTGEGQRDEAAKDLAGLLLHGGWAADEVDDFILLVARIAGDEEWRRRRKARGTARKLAEGGAVTGGSALAKRLTGNAGDGERIVAQVRAWLGLSGLGSAQVSPFPHDGQLSIQGGHSYRLAPLSEDGPLEPARRIRSVAYSMVEVKEIVWLWQGRIPLGTITVLDGDPGLGKSLLTIDLAARVTTGQEMPDGTPGVDGGVVLLSAEDAPGATIAPRLLAAGADMARVEDVRGADEWDAVTGQHFTSDFRIPRDIPLLEDVIQRQAVRLVVIDPLMAYLDMTVNSWRDQDVRSALAPLAALAEQTGAAVLILRHLNKASGMSAIQRGGGSIGIIAAARSGLLVAKHPDNPDHERVLAALKSNLGPPMPSLRYRLVPSSTHHTVPVVEWMGACEWSAAQLVAVRLEGKDDASPTKVESAAAWLREALADGPRPVSDVEQEALDAGFSETSLKRGRARLRVVSEHVGQREGGYWQLRLPNSTEQTSETGLKNAIPAQGGQPERVASLSDGDPLEQSGELGTTGTDAERCPVTGRPHEYAQLRDAEGRPVCVECGYVRYDAIMRDNKSDDGQGAQS